MTAPALAEEQIAAAESRAVPAGGGVCLAVAVCIPLWLAVGAGLWWWLW